MRFVCARCRNGTAINQVAIGWHDQATDSSAGIIPLTSHNWNATFRVPLAAVVDYKREEDPYLNVSFTLKFTVDGITLNTTKIPVSFSRH